DRHEARPLRLGDGNAAPELDGSAWHGACCPTIMHCATRLRREHDVIAGVLVAVEDLVRFAGGGRGMAMLPVAGAIEFFTVFVAGCHEAKESRLVFPTLLRLGTPEAEAFAVVEREHAEGERLLQSLRPDPARGRVDGDLARLLSEYVGLQRR